MRLVGGATATLSSIRTLRQSLTRATARVQAGNGQTLLRFGQGGGLVSAGHLVALIFSVSTVTVSQIPAGSSSYRCLAVVAVDDVVTSLLEGPVVRGSVSVARHDDMF